MLAAHSPAATVSGEAGRPCPRRFDFERDAFDFANELVWEYLFDDVTGAVTFRRRQPKPAYTHRCFVLTRAARLFLYHARFELGQPMVDASVCRRWQFNPHKSSLIRLYDDASGLSIIQRFDIILGGGDWLCPFTNIAVAIANAA